MPILKEFEQWQLMTRTLDWERECAAKGVEPGWSGIPMTFKTREEALAQIERLKKSDRAARWLVGSSRFRYRIQRRRIQVLEEEIL